MADDALHLTEAQVRAAQRGDQAAVESLFARYLPRVRRMVAVRMRLPVGELGHLEDVVQETMLDAFRSLERFELRSEGAFCQWLATIVGNNIRDSLRRAGPERAGRQSVRPFSELSASLSESILEGKAPPPSEQARVHETEARIERALLRLGDRYREIINLRCFGQMSYREIAEQMDLPSENTANVMFLRARKKLKDDLAGAMP